VTNCILCRAPTSGEPEEHIVPEGLIGDLEFVSSDPARPATERLVLSEDEVCKKCNTERTSRLDEHLQKRLAFIKPFLNRVGTKRGRPATTTLPGFYARGRSNGPEVVFNAADIAIHQGDNVIPSAKGKTRAVKSSFDESSGTIRVTYRVKFTKKFIRALHKIAFELLCKHKGAEYVLHDRFDALRGYILRGIGVRWVAVLRDNVAGPSMWRPGFQLERHGDDNWIVEVKLGGVYRIDLSPDSEAIRRVAHNEQAREQWQIFPVDIQVPPLAT
jgi:hypothetical protein